MAYSGETSEFKDEYNILSFLDKQDSSWNPITYVSPNIETKRMVDIIREKFGDRDNMICIDWLNGKCPRTKCLFFHRTPHTFKTVTCIRWKKNQCPFESIKCRHSHGIEDYFSNVKFEENSIITRIERAAAIVKKTELRINDRVTVTFRNKDDTRPDSRYDTRPDSRSDTRYDPRPDSRYDPRPNSLLGLYPDSHRHSRGRSRSRDRY